MSITPDQLMAYADGELAGDEARQVEEALATNPALSAQLAAQRALSARLRNVYEPVIGEPVPDALLDLIKAGASVADLPSQDRSRFGSRAWTAMAACLALGLAVGWGATELAGSAALLGPNMEPGRQLTAALDGALASQAQDGIVRIGLSFRDMDGDFCRTFTSEKAAGVACRETQGWQVQALAPTEGAAGQYRTASSMPPSVAAVVETMIAGAPLDAAAERAAKAAGWRGQ